MRASLRALALGLAVGLVPASACAQPARPARKVKIGVLKLTSSAPLFLGVEKGYFREAGLEPELVYFQAAQPIAVAIAAGELEVGATGLTAGLFNIVAGGEPIWVVGITQLGSTFHYMLGNLLEAEGLGLGDVEVVPLRALGAMAEALAGKRVDAILIPQPLAGTTVEQGAGRLLFWVGDHLRYQVAAIFYSRGFAQDRERAVAFMRGYVRASREYHDAVLARKDGPAHDEVVAITARYTGATPEIVRAGGFPYQDRDGRLDVADGKP
jgi:NitT/TauT family transport system substrate-binding protein